MASTPLAPMDFSQLHKGDRARVAAIRSNSMASLRLQEMGLTVGTEFTVIKTAPFGDPIEVHFRGCRLCLRRAETEGFDLEAME